MSEATALARAFEAWGLDAPDDRAAILNEALASDFIYSDPNCPARIIGAEAFNEMLGAFTRNMPGGSATVVGTPKVHNGFCRCTVAFGMGGKTMMEGHYFAGFDACGRIALLVGFIGTDGT